MKITTIRFNLKFFNADGEEEVVRTLDDLRDKFNLSDLDEYFKAGDLSRWLRGLGESKMADKVDSLKNVLDKRQSLEKLCNALGISMPKGSIVDYCNMIERQKKMKGARHCEREDTLRVDKTRPCSTRYLREKNVEAARIRACLAGVYDEKQKHDLVDGVIKRFMVKNDNHDNDGITIFGALLFNNVWREYMKRFYDIKAAIHVHGGTFYDSGRQMIIAVFPKNLSDSQLQGKREFEFGNSFPRYFPIYGFDYDIMNNSFVPESRAVEDLVYIDKKFVLWSERDPNNEKAYEVDKWKKEYVSIRWGNGVPSWEERKAEAEEMLKQWIQKHFYWN